MTGHMDVLNINQEERLLIKYYVIEHLIFLKIQNMADIKENLRQWFTYFLIKSLQTKAKEWY